MQDTPDRLWAAPHDLRENESASGVVRQLPERGAYFGNHLILDPGDGPRVGIEATGRRGHAALERELDRLGIRVGDHISITFRGWRQTPDGARWFRDYAVTKGGVA